MQRNPYLIWIISLGVATLIVITDVGQEYVGMSIHSDRPLPALWRLVLWPSIWWYGWAVLAVGVYRLTRKNLVVRGEWKKSLVVLWLGCVAAFVLHVGIQFVAMALPAFGHLHPTWDHALLHHAGTSIFLNVTIYWSIVGASHSFIFYTRYRQREVQAAQLESELHKATLQALRMQLQPHFLFNTLHAVSTLMYRDVASADQILARLGELLRRTIDQSAINEVTLAEEIDFVEKYLEIEQARFQERLRVQVEVEKGAEQAVVPNFFLQPLVENAVKHGVSRLSDVGVIEVRATTASSQLCVEVSDNGPGLDGATISHKGTGLTNTIERLTTLYGDHFSLDFTPREPSGLLVTLCIPLKNAATEASTIADRVVESGEQLV